MKTILVVDDFASVRFYHLSLLRQGGYETVTAGDGAEALAALENKSVDLVLLDLMMPKMNGIEFVQRVRASGRHAQLPILVITGEAHLEQARQLQSTPRLGLLAKPLLPGALLEEVRRLLV